MVFYYTPWGYSLTIIRETSPHRYSRTIIRETSPHRYSRTIIRGTIPPRTILREITHPCTFPQPIILFTTLPIRILEPKQYLLYISIPIPTLILFTTLSIHILGPTSQQSPKTHTPAFRQFL